LQSYKDDFYPLFPGVQTAGKEQMNGI